jgi:flagellar motor switch protein FliM
MTKQSTLSGEEIAALMNGLRDQESTSGAAPGVVRPFAFGGEVHRSVSALPALDRINERMARQLRDLIEPYARTKLRVTADATIVRTFEEWQAEQPDFTSLSLYSFKPLKGGILLVIEPEFVSRLVDTFYGGSGMAAKSRAREFTGTEDSLLGRLSESLMGVLAQAWGEVVTVRPQLRSRETNVSFANLVRPDESVAVARFNVVAPNGKTALIDILYPVASLRSVENELVAKSQEDASVRGEEWRERLATAVREVRVEARTVLARPELSLSELVRLQPGDVIPVSLPSHVPLLVEGRPIAVGTIGEHDGRAALMIERVENRRFIR